MTPEDRAVVLRVWGGRTTTEYATGALTTELLHQLAIVGVSPDTLERVHRVAGDEFHHARLCRAVYEAAGGEAPLPVDPTTLSSPLGTGLPLGEQVLLRVLVQLAIGETVAVPLFKALLEGTTVPIAADALATFVKDDAFHSAVGWDVLEELLERWPEDGRAALRPRVAERLHGFWLRYGGHDVLRTPAARSWGLMDGARYRAVTAACLAGPCSDRLMDLGVIDAPWTRPD